MAIYDQIKEALRLARITRSQRTLTFYSTLVGEIERNPKKDLSNDAVIKVIKKFIEGAQEVIRLKPDTDAALIAAQEVDLLTCYLPKMVEESVLVDAIKLIKTNKPDAKIQDVMKYFSEFEKSTGLAIDKSVASRLFKQIVSAE